MNKYTVRTIDYFPGIPKGAELIYSAESGLYEYVEGDTLYAVHPLTIDENIGEIFEISYEEMESMDLLETDILIEEEESEFIYDLDISDIKPRTKAELMDKIVELRATINDIVESDLEDTDAHNIFLNTLWALEWAAGLIEDKTEY